MKAVGSTFLICLFSTVVLGERLVPQNGDLCEFATTEDAIEAGSAGNYACRLSVIRGYKGHALQVQGASHDGGMSRKFGDLKLDILGAKTIQFFIRQNVSRTGNFYLVLRFDDAGRYVTRTIPGGAGWGKWEKVELDLSRDRLGKLEEAGIYSDVFANTANQYLQIDEMRFVVPGENEQIEKEQSPVLTVPKVDSKPLIDGKFEPGEWDDACATTGFVTLSGVLADRQTTVYVKYDDQNLYVAYRTVFESGGPPNMGNPGRMTYAEATSNLDFVEMWLQTPAGYHQLIVNMNGGLFERNVQNTPSLATGAKVACSLKMNEYLAGGVWNAELAIPFKGIGCSAPQEGDAWRVLFARTFSGQGARADRDWTSSNYTGGDFDRPGYFHRMRFSETAPAIQVSDLGDFPEGDVRLKGNVRPHGKETVKILLQIVDPKTGKVFVNDVLDTASSKADRKFEIGSLLKSTDGLHAKCLITVKGADRKTWYHQNFMFQSNPPFRVKCVPQGRSGGLLLDGTVNK